MSLVVCARRIDVETPAALPSLVTPMVAFRDPALRAGGDPMRRGVQKRDRVRIAGTGEAGTVVSLHADGRASVRVETTGGGHSGWHMRVVVTEHLKRVDDACNIVDGAQKQEAARRRAAVAATKQAEKEAQQAAAKKARDAARKKAEEDEVARRKAVVAKQRAEEVRKLAEVATATRKRAEEAATAARKKLEEQEKARRVAEEAAAAGRRAEELAQRQVDEVVRSRRVQSGQQNAALHAAQQIVRTKLLQMAAARKRAEDSLVARKRAEEVARVAAQKKAAEFVSARTMQASAQDSADEVRWARFLQEPSMVSSLGVEFITRIGASFTPSPAFLALPSFPALRPFPTSPAVP